MGHLAITDDAFLLGDDVVGQTAFHEIGRNFDERGLHRFMTRSLLDGFRNLSGWDKMSVGEQPAPGKVRSRDETWQHNWSANFVRDYGRTNPLDDFAATCAAHFTGSDYTCDAADRDAGVTDGRQLAPNKYAMLDGMFEFWGG